MSSPTIVLGSRTPPGQVRSTKPENANFNFVKYIASEQMRSQYRGHKVFWLLIYNHLTWQATSVQIKYPGLIH